MIMKMNKNIFYFLLAVFVGIILGIGLIYFTKGKKNYVAVFLNNGVIYFGKLSTFPRLKLTNAIFFQQDESDQLIPQRFVDAFWAPAGPIYLNSNSILFIAPLSESSPLVNFIEGQRRRTLPLQPSQPQIQPRPTSPPSTQ